jgi:hypothetical protein
MVIFSRTRDTSKKTFLANPRSRPGTWATGAVAELNEPSAKGWALVMEWAWV